MTETELLRLSRAGTPQRPHTWASRDPPSIPKQPRLRPDRYGGELPGPEQAGAQGSQRQASVAVAGRKCPSRTRSSCRERQQLACEAAAEQGKSNNLTATKDQRQYVKNAPGMDPANQFRRPTPSLYKATRAPIWRISPTAPATEAQSLTHWPAGTNREPEDCTRHLESINSSSHASTRARRSAVVGAVIRGVNGPAGMAGQWRPNPERHGQPAQHQPSPKAAG